MKVLVACEESQAVTIELRKLGHEAYSCDIEPCSGGHPEWHIQDDVLPLLNGGTFVTSDNAPSRTVLKWDMIIAFPPCTHLCVSGARHFAKKIADGRQQQGIDFFMMFANADCDKIAIENPIGIMSSKWRKPNQIIQPYHFGEPYSKSTCLWLKGLPELIHTNVLQRPEKGWENQSFTPDGRYGGFNGKFSTALQRSKTFPGIARAMAEQWAGECI